ncbi:DUF5752 family protein [Candidatus Bathyarchaeota archaeon]|nr:DUF5752 family protein [Candidatus Bathyarchaeota archaeon]
MKAEPNLKKATLTRETANKILRKVTVQEGFRFFRGIGDYTGKVAMSLEDFAVDLRTIDLRSIEFHFQRQDFEKWIRNVLGDEELAKSLSQIRRELQGEKLRNELIMVVTKRVEELKKRLTTA